LFTKAEEKGDVASEQGQPTLIAEPTPTETSSLTQLGLPRRPRIWKKLSFAYTIASIAIVCCGLLALTLYHRNQREGLRIRVSDSDPLWTPMFLSNKEIFISLGHAESFTPSSAELAVTSGGLQRITVTDLKAYTNISGFLQLNGHPFQMRTDTSTTLLDLRDRPVVLIGIRNNNWTLKLTRNLCYHFDFDDAESGKPNRAISIVDSQNSDRVLWQIPIRSCADPSVDYAIAGRFLDPVTGGLVLYVTGACAVGTQAASEFVTQPNFLRSLPERLRNPKTNFEVVLRTPVVGGVSGSPEVLVTDIQ
jgi:hypothetical protein